MTDWIVKHKIENILKTHPQRSSQHQDIYDTPDVFWYDDSPMTDQKS